jgi:hypothetical protein
MPYFGGQRGVFSKFSSGSETLDMTSEGLGRCLTVTLQTLALEICSLMLMLGQAEGLGVTEHHPEILHFFHFEN